MSSLNTQQNLKKGLPIVYLVAFIDMLGFGTIIPIISYFTEHLVTNSNLDITYKAFYGGILMSSYSLMQFIFAPILGRLSDKYGRRPVLFLSVFGNVLGYAMWAISNNFWFFLASRLISGGTGGNISVAQSYIADVTTDKERAKYMGMFGALFGLGFIFGPALGGMMSKFDISNLSVGWLTLNKFSMVGVVTLVLSLINLLLIGFALVEPINRKANIRLQKKVAAFSNLVRHLGGGKTGRLFLVYFLISLSFVNLEASFAWDLMNRFKLEKHQTSYIFVYLGIMMALIQGGLYRSLLKRYSELSLMKVGLAVTALGLIVLVAFDQYGLLFLSVFLLALGMGMGNPSITALASLYSSKDEQGVNLGMLQSYGSLARVIVPFTALYIYSKVDPAMPYYMGIGLAVLALLFAIKLPEPKKQS